nr:fatty-acid-binding protein 1-like [Ipomoea batatas]
MQEKASIQQQTHPELPTPSSDHAASTSAPPGNSSRQLIDELLSQAEIQEAIICDISNLCDVAEALCSAQEERLKKSFIDLPIWAKSPRELITSLCEECNSGMEEAYQDLRRKARTMAEASDDIKLRAGSVIEISRLLGYVLQIKVMGEVMSTVESKLLCRACIYLYLGDDPFDKEAKDKFGCLGHTCCLPFK